MIVDFATMHTRWPWSRQIGPGIAPGVTFRFGHEAGADWLVVYDDIREPLPTDVPKARRIHVVTEPPGIKTYPPAFLRQFGTILSPVALDVPGSRVVRGHPALPWFFGVRFEPGGERSLVYDLDGLRLLEPEPDRRVAVSAVISTKSQLPRHRERLAFVEALQARLGDRLTVFGQGFRPVADKAEAILPFRYHLVLENNDIPHFWTEKLADPLLGWALPLYAGCAEAAEDFPPGALVPLDLSDREGAIAAVEQVLAQDRWPSRLGLIGAARTRLIERHNLFAVLARLIAEAPSAAGPVRETIRPIRESGLAGRLKGEMRRLLRGR